MGLSIMIADLIVYERIMPILKMRVGRVRWAFAEELAVFGICLLVLWGRERGLNFTEAIGHGYAWVAIRSEHKRRWFVMREMVRGRTETGIEGRCYERDIT